jgi:hypothetical protein
MIVLKKIWIWFNHFPRNFIQGSRQPPATSGSAAAALISVGIGCFAMMITHHFAETSRSIDGFIWTVGKWIPGSDTRDPLWGSLGSYAGKETMLLMGWLISWSILHILLKSKHVKTRTIFIWTFGLIVAATVMSWQPLFPYLPLT